MKTLLELARIELEAEINGIRARFDADVKAGERDAKGGIFDKWYMHHRKDFGAAYRAGWEGAKVEGTDYQVIEG